MVSRVCSTAGLRPLVKTGCGDLAHTAAGQVLGCWKPGDTSGVGEVHSECRTQLELAWAGVQAGSSQALRHLGTAGMLRKG